MQDLVKYLTLQLKKEGQDKKEDTHPPKGEQTYLVDEVTHA
jgi:hypothetical protein